MIAAGLFICRFCGGFFAAVRPRRAVAVITDCTLVFMRSERDNAGMRGGQSGICAAGKIEDILAKHALLCYNSQKQTGSFSGMRKEVGGWSNRSETD